MAQSFGTDRHQGSGVDCAVEVGDLRSFVCRWKILYGDAVPKNQGCTDRRGKVSTPSIEIVSTTMPLSTRAGMSSGWIGTRLGGGRSGSSPYVCMIHCPKRD